MAKCKCFQSNQPWHRRQWYIVLYKSDIDLTTAAGAPLGETVARPSSLIQCAGCRATWRSRRAYVERLRYRKLDNSHSKILV